MGAELPRLEIRDPRLFTMGAVLIICAYGLLLMAPVLLAMAVVSVLTLSWLTFLLPLVTIGAATFFLPFGFGNPHATRLIKALRPDRQPGPEEFLVQLTLRPRIQGGLRALLEDADDIGTLSVADSRLLFKGDGVDLSIPLENIEELRRQSIGWRGFFLYGPKLTLRVADLGETETVQFAERSSWILPDSRATSRRMYEALSRRVPAASTRTGQAGGNRTAGR